MRKIKFLLVPFLLMFTLALVLSIPSTVMAQTPLQVSGGRGDNQVLLLSSNLPETSTAPIEMMPQGSTGGASADPPGYKVVLTPKEEAELAQKNALMQQIDHLTAAGYSPDQIRTALKLSPPTAISGAALLGGITPNSGTDPNYGYCNMSIWKEPESQPNWCGPGSGEAVISAWKSVPPSGYADATAYMTYLATKACKSGQKVPNCTGMMNGNTTYVSDWAYIVNHEIGISWYAGYQPSGLADYQAKLRNDIYYNSHPVNNLVDTKGLPGWGTYSCSHFLAADAYNFTSDTIWYGDTAPNSARSGGAPYPYGYHSVPLSNFYNSHVHVAGNWIMW